MIRRLNPTRDKNRIAAAKQINDSRVRHFSRATDFSNAFQNVRRFRRRKLCKYSPGGDDIFMPIFAVFGLIPWRRAAHTLARMPRDRILFIV
jgi:hypothetical protein